MTGSAAAPARLQTTRLLLRRPEPDDAAAIFTRYAGDADVGRYLAWRTHRSIEDTREFLAFSDAEWRRWPAGPYLVFDRRDNRLLGSTGLAFDSALRASTGYVLARDAWGFGYASEALAAMIGVAAGARVEYLYAVCHTAHAPSQRVLQKAGFRREARLPGHFEFPNDSPAVRQDVFLYSMNPSEH